MKTKTRLFVAVVLVLIILASTAVIDLNQTQAAGPGSVVAWGDNSLSQCMVPLPNSEFAAISSNAFHSLGLKSDGSVVAWGSNEYGQCDVPSPNTGFVAISAGARWSLGLKSDGSVVAWGSNDYGYCDVPSPNTGFVAISAGGGHSLGLKSDGSVVAWGYNLWGECDIPSPNAGFVAISAGASHSLGLKSDGSVVAWGDNSDGACSVPSPNTDFVDISAGWYYSLGLKSDGSVVAWGYNGYGQCDVPLPNTGFVAISAGGGHSLGLKSDGSVVAWGYNYSGECNVPSPNTGFVAVSSGGMHSLALRETVVNVPPTVGPITAPIDPVAVNTCFNVSAYFTDPDSSDTHTAIWAWEEGPTSTGVVNETNGSGTVNGSHSYTAPGVYTVRLTVTDKDGGQGTSVFQYVVVYDPTGGFVTGGGWINSPAGAYFGNSTLYGKATFGFVSKYQKGATVPTGQTEFQFHVANMNFKSTSYQWLVIAGAKAQYKGWGTIDGTGDYSFMLTAIDGQINGGGGVDKFRIKIWDKVTGNVIYDNQIGALDTSDTAVPQTAIAGGSIVIHK